MDEQQLMEGLESVLGPVAVMSLLQRGLVVVPSAELPLRPAPAEVVTDRVAGAFLGVACGAALAELALEARRRQPNRRVSATRLEGATITGAAGLPQAETLGLALAARAWMDDGWAAPVSVSDRLVREVNGLGVPGRAIVATVENRQAGAPWFEAGVGSFGNGALTRAVAVGARYADRPELAPVAGSLDAAVSHASGEAVAASAAVAWLVAALVNRPADEPVPVTVRSVLARLDPRAHPAVTASLQLDGARSTDAMTRLAAEPTALASLATAAWMLLRGDRPEAAIAKVAARAAAPTTHAAVTGALVGTAFGAGALPERWLRGVRHAPALRALAAEVAQRVTGVAPTTSAAADERASIWFLLDRSGSMGQIAPSVVRGFDRFFAEQREAAGDALVTVVQFDDQDPHDVVVDAQPVGAVPSLADRFQPRGMTPLFDAIGLLLDRAEHAGGVDADQLVVILTDGEENASRQWDHRVLFDRIGALRERGWTFVFLGANQDSYLTGRRMGMTAGNTSNFMASADGVDRAYAGLSRATREWRGKDRATRQADRDRFWGDTKEAEER